MTKTCSCGCGQPTKRDWYPGHDTRALTAFAKKESGSVKQFLIDAGYLK